MCGRYNVKTTGQELAEAFEIDDDAVLETWRPRYNVAPTQRAPIVRVGADGRRQVALLRWGLVPSWAKDVKIGATLINARSETIAEKPAFRAALRRRRCLVPATGFYEWRPNAEGKGKQPLNILRKDGAPFAMAGLFEAWRSPDGASLETFTILTTAPNAVVAAIHDRMPVILAPEHAALWLDPEIQSTELLSGLFVPAPADDWTSYLVSSRVGTVSNDDAELLEPIASQQPLL